MKDDYNKLLIYENGMFKTLGKVKTKMKPSDFR